MTVLAPLNSMSQADPGTHATPFSPLFLCWVSHGGKRGSQARTAVCPGAPQSEPPTLELLRVKDCRMHGKGHLTCWLGLG